MAGHFGANADFFPQPKTVIISDIKHIPLFRNKFFLHQKYVVEGLSIAQIAEEIFSSKEAVRKGLQKTGIEVREAHQPHGRQSQPKFGAKRFGGKVTEHKTEQKVIDAIEEMRRNKMGLRQIARCLSQMGVPTKCKGVKWHPEMVRRIIRHRLERT
jgi:hypothetical protein